MNELDIIRKQAKKYGEVGIDDASVTSIAYKMRNRLAQGREAGRYGWYDPNIITVAELETLLRNQMTKGTDNNTEPRDYVDIACLAMMLHFRTDETSYD